MGRSWQRLYGTNFAEAVITALGRKVELRQHYGSTLANRRLATL